jgi:hypothetical protein
MSLPPGSLPRSAIYPLSPGRAIIPSYVFLMPASPFLWQDNWPFIYLFLQLDDQLFFLTYPVLSTVYDMQQIISMN